MDAADFGGGQEYQVGAFLLEELLRGRCIFQVEFGMGARDEVGVALALQFAHDGATGEAAMAGDVDFRGQVQGERGKVQVKILRQKIQEYRARSFEIAKCDLKASHSSSVN